jgi:hypothetical protein
MITDVFLVAATVHTSCMLGRLKHLTLQIYSSQKSQINIWRSLHNHTQPLRTSQF